MMRWMLVFCFRLGVVEGLDTLLRGGGGCVQVWGGLVSMS